MKKAWKTLFGTPPRPSLPCGGRGECDMSTRKNRCVTHPQWQRQIFSGPVCTCLCTSGANNSRIRLHQGLCARVLLHDRRNDLFLLLPAVHRKKSEYADTPHLGTSWVWTIYVSRPRPSRPSGKGCNGFALIISWLCGGVRETLPAFSVLLGWGFSGCWPLVTHSTSLT